MKLLVVDDEKTMAEAIRDNLEFEGLQADCAYGGRPALELLQKDHYALVILDVMMPDLDGFNVLKHMRAANNNTPVIFVTARAAEADTLRGLGLGADDYVVKPFSILELMARVKAILKRTAPQSELQQLPIGNVRIDFLKLTIESNQTVRQLGRYEAGILRLLASEPGRIFSRNDILDAVWGLEAYPSNRTIDNQIVKLRQKIEPNPEKPRHILSVYGKGYKFEPG